VRMETDKLTKPHNDTPEPREATATQTFLTCRKLTTSPYFFKHYKSSRRAPGDCYVATLALALFYAPISIINALAAFFAASATLLLEHF